MSSMDKTVPTLSELIGLLSVYNEVYICGDIYGGATLQVLHEGYWKDVWSVG